MLTKLKYLVFLIAVWPANLLAQERYLIAYAGFAGFQSPLWATKELGLLAKYGVAADLVLTPGSTRQIQALVGNSAHFAQVDAVTTINAIGQGADLVMISGSLNTFPFSFVAQKEIRKPDDLTGKKIGIVGFGGYIWNRPDVVYRDNFGTEFRNRWKADSIVFSVGAVYSIF